MNRTYTLVSGEEVTGPLVSVMRTLDKIDPLSDQLLMSLTDEETLQEFDAWKEDLWWCADIGCVVARSTLDGYSEHVGDSYLIELLRTFNEGRRAWGMNQVAKAEEEGDKGRAKLAAAYVKYVNRALGSNATMAFIRLWKPCREIDVTELNRNPYMMGTPFGVMDMMQGCLLYDYNENTLNYDGKYYEEFENEGAREYMITKKTRGIIDDPFSPVEPEYDERWDQFVLEVMNGDEEKADYLRRALGYSIFGGNPEEVMFVAYGATTRNGKGTLLNSIAWALGDYAAAASPDFLLEKAHTSQGDKDEIAMMAGKRFITISEPPKGRRLDESKVKSFTGNDPITTSKKYGHTFTYEPQFTMWLSCNNLPTVSDTSVFVSGRMRVIPFERHFDETDQDSSLKERFRTDVGMHTILTWLMRGFSDYLMNGLDEPKSIKRATALWSNTGGDDFTRFIDTQCVINTSERVSVEDFKAAYKKWCEKNESVELTTTKVNRRLKEYGVPKKRAKSNGKCYYAYFGIALKKNAQKDK